jgi:hypothetical protein
MSPSCDQTPIRLKLFISIVTFMVPATMHLLDLIDDILFIVFNYLDVVDIITLRTVSIQLRYRWYSSLPLNCILPPRTNCLIACVDVQTASTNITFENSLAKCMR